jgi:predicted metal-dependent hydrolase
VPLEANKIEHLRRGMQHFQAGDYFAAHDDWETVWQDLRGRPRIFWQAMIQLAVGAYHFKNDNRKGCQSLWNKALLKCHDLTPTYDGNPPPQLLQLTALLQTCLTTLQQAEDPRPHIVHFANTVLTEGWFAFQ